jgi:vitamin B12 transporter
MKKFILPWIFILLAAAAMAQVKISGNVKDNKNRPLIGASITLKNTYDGATTDSTGKFFFKTTEKGDYVLEVKSINYKTLEQKVAIANEPINLAFVLKEEINELSAVTVTAGSFEAGDKKRAAAVLTSLDIVTTGGANGDITAALKTLPGAQQVGEQEGLFVRGGTGYETKQFIDGTVVNNPFGTSIPDIASRGRFSPFLFKGTVFSTGGYSALYGQALSGAVILESIDLPEQSQATASISSVFLGAGFQSIAKDKKSSWGVNYGYTNLVAYFNIVKQKPDYFQMPEFHNGDANFRIKTKKGMIKYYTTFAWGRIGLRREDIDSAALKDAFGYTNLNWYNNVSWRENLGKGWKFNLGLSYSTNKDDVDQKIQNASDQNVTTGKAWIDDKNFMLNSKQDLSQIKAVFEKRLKGISVVRFGAEYWYGYTKSKYNQFNTLLVDNFKSVFGETDIYITNGLAAKLGARFEHSSIINKANIAPRLSLAYKVGKDAQMSLAYGDFYQKPENQQLTFTNNLGYIKATHYIANYQKTNQFYTFRVEAFYKKYADLVKTYPAYNNDGTGFAQGIEVFFRDKKTIKNFDYWISYSYLDTKRDYLNYPGQLQPNFAAKHTASLVTKRFVTEWKTGFNFTYTFATGRPYYLLQQNGNKYEIKDQGTTTNYNTLGFSLNYLPNLGKSKAKTFIVLVASITNVLNQKQVYGYNYNYFGNIKQAINPPAPQFFFLGAFLSWGVDRSQDAINNNL